MSGPTVPSTCGSVPTATGRPLYYLSYFTDTVHRISRSGANTAPIADFSYRPDGLTVSFSGAASHDDDAGDGVTSWAWDFGDGATATTTTPTTSHTYAGNAPVQVTLTVVDAHGLSSTPTSKTVYPGEHPPSIVIAEPDPDARFAVGRPVRLVGQASDAEDGVLPGSAITWSVRLQHGNHYHPYLGPVTGGSVTTTYPAPEELAAARTSRLVVTATAVDSRGLTTTVERALLPKIVELTFRTSPRGGRLVIQGERRRTPLTVKSWVGYVFPVRAPDQAIGGVPSVFDRWSDGGALQHDIRTPATATATRPVPQAVSDPISPARDCRLDPAAEVLDLVEHRRGEPDRRPARPRRLGQHPRVDERLDRREGRRLARCRCAPSPARR